MLKVKYVYIYTYFKKLGIDDYNIHFRNREQRRYTRGVDRIIFSIHGRGKLILKNCVSFLWFEEIIVIRYNLVNFLYNCMENISVQMHCFI